MIFLNRRRSPNRIKNPSKYWYVEKYVYGELKETVEVPLGTSTTFSAIDSGYDDDTFYGWSVSGTNTTISFNNTSSYSNTTDAVKNNLDENNVLRIYAVYRYYTSGTTYISKSAVPSSTSQDNHVSYSGRYKAAGNGTLTVSGYVYYEHGDSSGITRGYGSVSVSVNGTSYSANKDASCSVSINTGDVVEYYISGYYQGGSVGGMAESYITISSSVVLYDLSYPSYRVSSHT